MSTKRNPNILLIHTDQLRMDCLGVYGNTDICTPNIDRLALDGVRYQNSFCPFPSCTPSRYSLLSGLYAREHTGMTNHSTLPANIDTFPYHLKKIGYRTKAIGKMHFTPPYLDVGFEDLELADKHIFESNGRDYYYSYLESRDLSSVSFPVDVENFGAGESQVTERDHITTWTADRAIEEINHWGPEKQFLMVGFDRPHRPFDPPDPWNHMYDPKEISTLPGWTEQQLSLDSLNEPDRFHYKNLTEDKCKEITALYYALISQMDFHVGRMIDVLKKKGLYDNTLIIFTSDHGEYMGFHHLMGKLNYMYDSIMKVPLIIKFPGQTGKGTTSNQLVNNMDIAPTILNQAGANLSQDMKGLDLSEDWNGREYIFAERAADKEYMIRSRTRKLLLVKEKMNSQFFNLDEDPLELNNLFNDLHYQDEIKLYMRELEEFKISSRPIGDSSLSPKVIFRSSG